MYSVAHFAAANHYDLEVEEDEHVFAVDERAHASAPDSLRTLGEGVEPHVALQD